LRDESTERLAQNELVFRELNERLEAGHWPGDEATALALRCECGHLGCNQLLELTPADYERVRANPRRFVVIAGHERHEVETVVDRIGDYLVVEKRGEAGELAESQDPRE
jgi:hypothetical protein